MVVTLQMYLIVLPLVFVAACIDAIAGGGGLISLPAYMVSGLPATIASGSNKMSATFGTLIAAFKYMRGGKVLWAPALIAALAAIPGASLGAELLALTPEDMLGVILLTIIPLMAVVMLLMRNAPDRQHPMTKARLALCALVGLLCGLYDGYCGPGTGTLLIMGLTLVVGMDTVTASGTAKIVNLSSGLTALIVHCMHGYVLYQLAIPAMFIAALGGYVGSALAMKRGARFVRYVMLLVMAILIIKLMVDYL